MLSIWGEKKSNKNPFYTYFEDLIPVFVYKLLCQYFLLYKIDVVLCPNILQTNYNL